MSLLGILKYNRNILTLVLQCLLLSKAYANFSMQKYLKTKALLFFANFTAPNTLTSKAYG